MERTGNKVRNCKICKKPFLPKTREGLIAKYKTCSRECANLATANSKIKYTSEEIQQVMDLKKQFTPNYRISEITKVKLWKIKEIVNQNKLFLTKEQGQKNAYDAKLEKNPNSMRSMREAHMSLSEEEFIKRNELLEQAVLSGRGTISGLAESFGLVDRSCVEYFKRMGKQHLLLVKESTPQKEIALFLENHTKEQIKYNDRQTIKPLELDIYIPNLKLAIEFCGLYWHSDVKKDKRYHLNKLKLCNEKGIRLITIFEDEWYERKEQVKGFLLSVIGKNLNKIDARKTELRLVSKEEAKNFLKGNHIQGSSKCEINYGLYFDNKLVGLISGGKHHRQGHNAELILNRMAFESNVTVRGGASKLLKSLITHAVSNRYSKIVSWSDNRWSEGNVYQKIGFTLEEELLPDYSYVKGLKRYSKQTLQKRHFIKMGAIGNTEKEMSQNLGFHRIYDCGKKRWILLIQS